MTMPVMKLKLSIAAFLITTIAACTSSTDEQQTRQAVVSTDANACITEAAGRNLTCTANDVRVAEAVSIHAVGGGPLDTCVSGTNVSFVGVFRIALNTTARLDPRFFFGVDGDPNHDGALSGTCASNVITSSNTNNFTNLDGDTCGDINTNQLVEIEIDNVPCVDNNGDGKLDLPTCTSWKQPGSDTVCNTATDTVPGSPSKCSCDAGFNVPITVEHGAIAVTKVATPLSLPEPGGEFTFAVSATNTASFTALTIDHICDNRYGTVAGAGCPAGTLGTVNSTDCTVPQTLAPGTSYACSFKANFTATDPATDTDTVTFAGTDTNGGPVSGSASATVSVTDVPPTAVVLKSFGALLCSTVHYQVAVTNTSATDALSLTKLIDSSFGDILTVHDHVLATTCVPTSVPVGATATCGFDAQFCAASDTDTITATLDDGEGNTIAQPSNTITINVGATIGP